MLGFETPRTAQRLINSAASNTTPASHLDEAAALRISAGGRGSSREARWSPRRTTGGFGGGGSWLARSSGGSNESNAGVLGFETPRTAQRLINSATSNTTLTSYLDEAAALRI